jgi:hypothetical protein
VKHRVLALIVVIAASSVAPALMSSVSSATKVAPAWPKTFHGKLNVWPKSDAGQAAFGTPIPPSTKKGSCGHVTSKSYVGNVGWGIGCFNAYQYPVTSLDHGRTWVTGGEFFAGPWADGARFVSTMKAVTSLVVIAYEPKENTLYTTTDGGHHWYVMSAPGAILATSDAKNIVTSSPAGLLRMEVKTESAPAQHPFKTFYDSSNGGRTWSLQVSSDSKSNPGYGLIVGTIGPCGAKGIDAAATRPLIIVLSHNGTTYTSYDVTGDRGTASYHFDVPIGLYELTTTWPRTTSHQVKVDFGLTTRVDIKATCAPQSN